MKTIDHLLRFLTQGIWRVQSRRLSRWQSLPLLWLRVLVTSFTRFSNDNCHQKASSLTYYTLLSIVPVLAAAFGISKGFGFQEHLISTLKTYFSDHQEVLNYSISFATNMLEQTKGGIIAGVGVAFLLYTVLMLINNIEVALNQIWGLHRGRTFGRKFSDYLALILICPILFTFSSSLTLYIGTELHQAQEINLIGPMAGAMIKMLPYLLIWSLFTFVYLFIPNTKVSIPSGLFAGILAGTLYQFVQWIYIKFQIGVIQYGAVYGSFAALPLFLIWLQMSWLIVLYGAEVCAAIEHSEDYEFQKDVDHVSHLQRRNLALLILHTIQQRFRDGEPPYTPHEIGLQLELPIRLVKTILHELVLSGLLNDKEGAYSPACEIGSMKLSDLLLKMNRRGTEALPDPTGEAFQAIQQKTKHFTMIVSATPENCTLDQL